MIAVPVVQHEEVDNKEKYGAVVSGVPEVEQIKNTGGRGYFDGSFGANAQS